MDDLFACKPPKLDDRGRDMLDAAGKPVADERGVFERVPDVVVAAVARQLDEFFEQQKLAACAQHRSARAVAEKLTKYLGVQMWALGTSHGGGSGAQPNELDSLQPGVHWGAIEALSDKLLE
eukprot:1604538-Prymnesium_polylepis.1